VARRRALWGVLGALLLGAAVLALRSPRRPHCARCNVLLVTFDALRADHLGAYGYPKPTSPRLDGLAARSSVFTRSLSQSASTIASIPSLHTSKFPHLDLLLARGVLRAHERTLAELLAAAGYATAAVVSNQYAGCRWGVCRGFEAIDERMEVPAA
jgi:arylsulfatase